MLHCVHTITVGIVQIMHISMNVYDPIVYMTIGSIHGWVDQFATKPKSLFIQKNSQILEITTSLH